MTWDIVVLDLETGIDASLPWYYALRDVRFRFSTGGHFDLLELLPAHAAPRASEQLAQDPTKPLTVARRQPLLEGARG